MTSDENKCSGSEPTESNKLLDWRAFTPAPLQHGTQEIRKRFALQASKVRYIMQHRCYPALHPRDHRLAEPTVFLRYFDGGTRMLGRDIQNAFTALLDTALANSTALDRGPVEWAELQTVILIQEEASLVSIWLKKTCDEQNLLVKDPDKGLCRSKWRAPKWLLMKPYGNLPYDRAVAWAREDEASTEHLLKEVCERFHGRLQMALKEIASKAQIRLGQGTLDLSASPGERVALALPSPEEERFKTIYPDDKRDAVLKRTIAAQYISKKNLSQAQLARWLHSNGQPLPRSWRQKQDFTSWRDAFQRRPDLVKRFFSGITGTLRSHGYQVGHAQRKRRVGPTGRA